LAEARRRIAQHPDRYYDHIYGEKELGGCGWLYLFSVSPEKLGFPATFAPGAEPHDFGSATRRRGVMASLGTALAAMASGLAWLVGRRNELAGGGGAS
jgi:hypothetical protein